MDNKIACSFISGMIFSCCAISGTMGALDTLEALPWVRTISMGPVWEQAGKTQTLFLNPDIEKTYFTNKHTSAIFDGEVFLGKQKTISEYLQGQLGLAIAATTNAHTSGEIWDDAQIEFNNYVYNYAIQHTHIAAKTKILLDKDYLVMPWVSASIGVGFNYAHKFNSTPTIPEAVATPDFTSKNTTAFTYTVGAGIQKNINNNISVGIGYEFADWGKSQLGRTASQTLGNGLTLNHLYTNGFLINLTYTS